MKLQVYQPHAEVLDDFWKVSVYAMEGKNRDF